ncbi:hypothetical protein VNO78_22526 [Psophocarpus tetragonolobus]|uniref:Cytochrome b561 domain-containing protein n=1 Tax=Psophocarpus tetragonolobus TaxID=3891 RepID=A0AAN9XCP7_PSOTE
MAFCCLILVYLGLFVPFHPIYAQNEKIVLLELGPKINEMEVQMHATPETANKTTEAVYQILMLIGWGTLLPIGVIIARYFRHFPMSYSYDVWFKCHIGCQTVGYIVGTTGWCISLWPENSPKHLVSKAESTLSTIAFTFINVQMLATFMRLHKEVGYCKCWNICHHLLGYAIIGLVITNIFAGFHNETLKWIYVGVLVVLTVVVIPLEICKCKSKIMDHLVNIHRQLWNREGIVDETMQEQVWEDI